VIEPLIVRRMGDGFELIAGERRLRAARLAGLTSVPVVVRDDLDDRAALEVSLVENLLRENLSVIEEGQAFARLNREFGLTHEMIATRLGKSRSYVTNVIRMLELPDEVRAMIQRGELTAGQTRPLLALDSAAAQVAGARRIAAEGLPARAAERLAAEHKAGARGGAEGQAAARNPFLAALTESLQRALHRKVRIVRGRGAGPGYIELEFYDDEDLTALARMLAAAGE
jgi:ParB family chromosome partitioning protein